MKTMMKILAFATAVLFLATKNILFLLCGEIFCLLDAFSYEATRQETLRRSFANHLIYLGGIDIVAFVLNYSKLQELGVFFALFTYVEITFLLISVNLIVSVLITAKIYDVRHKMESKSKVNPAIGSPEMK